jgi:hypothetical protein
MMKHLVTFTALLLTAGIAQADSRVGNGGDGYRHEDGKVYLLDLLEAGVEKEPFFGELPVNPGFLARVKTSISFLEALEAELVAKKLTEISAMSPVLARSLLKAMEMHSWSLVSYSLSDIPDEDTNLEIDPKKLVQVAIRRNSGVKISRDAWKDMDQANRSALPFHEAAYALLPLQCETGRHHRRCRQESVRAREIVGYLFSRQITRGKEALEAIIAGALPSGAPSGGILDDGSVIRWNMKLNLQGDVYISTPNIQTLTQRAQLPAAIRKVCARVDWTLLYPDISVWLTREQVSFSFQPYLNRQGESQMHLAWSAPGESQAFWKEEVMITRSSECAAKANRLVTPAVWKMLETGAAP